jgi:hypothetical protein
VVLNKITRGVTLALVVWTFHCGGNPMSQVAFALIALVAIAKGPPDAAKGGVTVSGTTIPHATSTISTTVDITEFREGTGDRCARLLSGCKHYAVCVVSPAPVAVLDAVLPQSAVVPSFSVGVEDGREFSQCLLSGLSTANNGKPTFTYCFKCEDVSAPPG